jgi:predicted nucleic acid-binding protein
MTGFVIDASVALKWVISEDGTAQALSFLPGGSLSAPELIVAQCANILWKKVRLGQLNSEEALMAAQLIERADVELHPMRSLLEPATRLAIELDHPAHDCVYLALAMANETCFVTADGRFVAKVRQTAPKLAERVLPLEEARPGQAN